MKHQLLCVAIAAAMGLPLAAPVHAAQDNSAVGQKTGQGEQSAAEQRAEEATELTTVTVTARRRSENVEKIPVAVSSFSAQDLKDLQATDITGLQGAVPGLNIVQGRGSSSSVNVFIRGIGQPDALQTFDPGVAFYVDDVYYSRIQGAMFSLFDVDHVEVLRGPQGTLYGKNSTGGAIKVVTKDPSNFAEGAIEATVGNYDRRGLQFYASGPLSDTVSASFAGMYAKRDGYVTNPETGRDFNDDDTRAMRAKIRFAPSNAFSATFALDYTRSDTALTLGKATAPLVGVDLATGPVLLYMPPEGEYDYTGYTAFGPDKGQQTRHRGAALHLESRMSDNWDFKSITSYRKLDSDSYIDIDATEYQLGDVFVGFNQKQFSQEFQFLYNNGSNFEAVYGLYYLKENVPSHQEAYADDFIYLGGAKVDFLRTIDDDLTNQSAAAFAHMDWEFSPSWTLAAGLRFTSENKEYQRSTSTFWSPVLAAFNETVAFSGEEDWQAWTPSISLRKQFSPQVMAYASVNRGFKSGGFNGRANTVAQTHQAVFDPEFVWTYEMGLKMRSADNRLQGNVAVYHSDYSDFQARVSEIVDPDSPTPSFTFPVLNAAELKISGIEFEGVALVGNGTRLSTQIAYMDASYGEFDDPRTALNPALANLHEHVPFSPELTARVAATHTFVLGNGGALTFGGDVSYRDDTWLSVDNRPGLMQEAYTVSGLFGVFDSPLGSWQLRAGVRNLGDEVYKTDGQEFSSVANIQTVYFGAPRNWYVSARYNFL